MPRRARRHARTRCGAWCFSIEYDLPLRGPRMGRSAMTMLAAKMMLERSPLFRGLAAAPLQRLASLAAQRKFRAGEIVFSQGDPGDALYGVIVGRVRISAGATDGREIYLNIMQPGDTFGEIALLDGGQRTATATTTD